jgi:hypothetical protein
MSRCFLTLVVAGALFIGLAVPTAASAVTTTAPPGNSGVDQYLEVVPTAGGSRPANGKSGAPLPRRLQRALDDQGADGRALRRITEATAPAAARRTSRKPRDSVEAGRPGALSASRPSSVLSSAVGALHTGSAAGGMGLLLPLLLIGSAAAAGVVALLRRRA